MALTVSPVGVGVNTTSTGLRVASRGSLDALISDLQSYGRTAPNRSVAVNFATGSAASEVDFNAAAQFVKRGGAWVDFGAWPFGANASGFLAAGLAGFSAFVHASGLTNYLGAPPSNQFDYDSALAAQIATPIGGYNHVATGYPFGYGDLFDFFIHDWFFGTLTQGRYPYPFALITTTDLSHVSYARLMPGAPSFTTNLVVNGQSVTLHFYSVFALRIGRGWYFNAQPETDPASYARFIAGVLGATAAGSTGSAPAPTRSVRAAGVAAANAGAHCLDVTLREGSTGGYVVSLQAALKRRGYNLGTTGPAHNGVDGDFGPVTLGALKVFQRSNVGRSNPCGRIVLDGVVGPAVWYALGVTGPGALPASSSVSTHAAKVTTHVARAHAVKTAAKKTTVSSQAAQAATAGAKGFLVEYEDSISKALHIPAGTVLPLTGAAIVGVIVLAATNKK